MLRPEHPDPEVLSNLDRCKGGARGRYQRPDPISTCGISGYPIRVIHAMLSIWQDGRGAAANVAPAGFGAGAQGVV